MPILPFRGRPSVVLSQQENPVGGKTARRELLRFAAAGILGLAVDVAVLYLAMAIGMDRFSGRGLSFLAAVWTTWQFNRRFTFTRRDQLSAWKEWWRYLSAMLAGGAVNYAVYSVIVIMQPGLPLLPMIAVAAGSLAGMSVNFIGAKYFVFRSAS